MCKRVLLLGGNFFPEPTGIGKYNGEMIDWLSNHGFTCSVITSFPYYPYWQIQDPYKKRKWWFKKEVRMPEKNSLPINIIRVPHFVPHDPSGLTRIVSDFSFFTSAFLVLFTFLFKKKFDYIIAVVPPFQLGLLAILYKKIKGAKFFYHIQDLQIDVAKDFEMIKSKPVVNALFSIEKFILKNADCLSSISEGMIKRVKIKCGKEVLKFPNWVDTKRFYPLQDKKALKQKFGFSLSDKIILYSGAIGEKQGLEAILYSAKNLKNIPDLKYVICGSGPYKEKLQILQAELGLENVIFYPIQPADVFNEFLNIADLHLLLQKSNASDLVMPSKLTTILSVGGVAIVTANKGTSLYQLVSSSKAGILIEPQNQKALDNAISDSLLYDDYSMKKYARHFAEEHLCIDKILLQYLKEAFKDEEIQIEEIDANVVSVL